MATSIPTKPAREPIPQPYPPHRSSSSSPPTNPAIGGTAGMPPAISVTATSPPGAQSYGEGYGSPSRRYHDRFNRPSLEQSSQAAMPGQASYSRNGQYPYQAPNTQGGTGRQDMAREYSTGPADKEDALHVERRDRQGEKVNHGASATGGEVVKGPKIGKNEFAEGWTKEDEEAEKAYVAGGMFEWKEMMNWRFWIRKKWWYWYIIIIVLCVLVGLMSLYKDEIIRWLTPIVNWMKNLPGGWGIPIAVLVILNFPPLFGQEIVCLLCGLVWGLWWGFGIVAAGTMIGEIALFFAMKYCLRSYAVRLEEKNSNYACLAHVVRNGGFFILFVIRFSAIPGHFSTAVFATCGVGFWVFTIATFLTLPKQMILVYLGTIFKTPEQQVERENDKTEKIVTYVTLVVGLLLTAGSMWYIYRAMKKAKLIIWRRERLAAKAAASSPASQSAALDPDAPIDSTSLSAHGGAKVHRRISYREMLEQPNDDIEALRPMLTTVNEHPSERRGQGQGQGQGWGWSYGSGAGRGYGYDDPYKETYDQGQRYESAGMGNKRVSLLFFPIPRPWDNPDVKKGEKKQERDSMGSTSDGHGPRATVQVSRNRRSSVDQRKSAKPAPDWQTLRAEVERDQSARKAGDAQGSQQEAMDRLLGRPVDNDEEKRVKVEIVNGSSEAEEDGMIAGRAVPVPDVVPPICHTLQGVTSPAKPESALLPAGMAEGRHTFGAVAESDGSVRSSSSLSQHVTLGSEHGPGHDREEGGWIGGIRHAEGLSRKMTNPWPAPPTAH